ncbi:MAG: ATP synthase F1 subunit epsilon [Coriobacteriales bacterium]|jgi:F-type H+-transporting ATPase subunit epsilon|nr:ATP synthase F1 subunit epsilon [Coriobacteriales bacterium]
MTSLLCDIVTPERQVFSEEVVSVSLPGTEGDFGILQRRAAMMSTLRPGEIRVQRAEGEEPLRFAVDGGYAENDGSKVVVLASRAVDISLLDAEEIARRRDRADQALAAAVADDSRTAFLRSEAAWYTLLDRLLSR